MKDIKVYTKDKIITIGEDGNVSQQDHINPRNKTGIYITYGDVSFKVKK